MNVSVDGSFRSLRSPLVLKIKQRIGIKVGAENTEPPFGDAWALQPLEFVTQRAIAPLRRVEGGEPPGWIRSSRRVCQSNTRIDDARPSENDPRDMRWRDARPARLLSIDDQSRSHDRFRFGDRIRVKA